MKISKLKGLVLLGLSTFGVSLLVGSTFAAFAVTDNASPFSISISLANAPVAQGFYLTFADDGYSALAGSAIKMSSNSENKAYASNVVIADGDQARIYYYDGLTYDGNGTSIAPTLGEAHGYVSVAGDNATMVFDTDHSGNTFSIYLNNSDLIYMVDETYASFYGYYVTYMDDGYAFRAANKLTDYDTGTNVADISITIGANKSFRVQHFNGPRGIVSTPNKQAADYPHFTTTNAQAETINTREAGTYHLMVSRGDGLLYISNDSLSSASGYYVVYSSSGYDYRQGTKMNDASGGNLATLSLDIAANTTIKIVHVDAASDYVYSDTYVQGDSGKAYLSTNVNSQTLTFNKADTYMLYLSADTKVYTTIDSYITITLKTGGSSLWNQAGAKFYAWVWETGQGGRWQAMTVTSANSDWFEMTIHSYETNMIFARCSTTPTSSGDLDNGDIVWNKTVDLTCGSNNCYTITAWGNNTKVCPGSWSTI